MIFTFHYNAFFLSPASQKAFSLFVLHFTVFYCTVLYCTVLYLTLLQFILIQFISWIYIFSGDFIYKLFSSIKFQLSDGKVNDVNENPALIRLQQKIKQLKWKLNILETSLKVNNVCGWRTIRRCSRFNEIDGVFCQYRIDF